MQLYCFLNVTSLCGLYRLVRGRRRAATAAWASVSFLRSQSSVWIRPKHVGTEVLERMLDLGAGVTRGFGVDGGIWTIDP